MIDFTGQQVLVTGASKGIGAACARLFGKLGAEVAVHYNSDRAGAEEVAASVRREGRKAFVLQAALEHWQEGERLVQEAERQGGALAVVVLNHGIWKGAPIDQMTDVQYDEMLNINLRSYVSVAGAAARVMKKRKQGRLVLIASTAGQRGEADHSHYAASKGAIISLTKSLGAELAPFGILVNCVAPGWVDTTMSQGTLAEASSRAQVLASIPLRRVASPEEIAGPVAFLASNAATFICGEILNVNGGAVLVG